MDQKVLERKVVPLLDQEFNYLYVIVKTTWISEKDIKRKWHLVDADGVILGRLASGIAQLLLGKSKVDAVPNMDCGDYVVVINASELRVTGTKLKDKKYMRHSGYPGGLKEETLGDLMKSKPEKVVWHAVRNMLPKNKHRDNRMSRLMTYAGSDHPHEPQKPKKIEIKS